MAGIFTSGETKTRPGVYFRTIKNDNVVQAENIAGIVAIALRANWGPLGEVRTLESEAEIYGLYGDDSAAGSYTALIRKALMGGAARVKVVRVGTGGTKAAITLKDTTGGTPVSVITLTAKYAGTRPLSVTIRDSLADPTNKRECIIYTGTKELTKVEFAKGSAEVDALVAAIAANGASAVTAAKLAAGNGTLADLTQTAFTTVGASPTITNTDYSNAFTLLEAESWKVLCVDSVDTTVHALVSAFITRANASGILGIAVISEPKSVALATRKADAAAFNSHNVVYVLNGAYFGTTLYEGADIAAVIAGLIAAMPTSNSVTHKAVPNMSAIAESFTNTEIEEALKSGCLVLTTSSAGTVWVEQGINTLVTLGAEQDAGWKKIRRTMCRFELITRANAGTEGIVGQISNDKSGRATIIAAVQSVINAMIAEGKLVSGRVYEDPNNIATGDSAWFVIEAEDLDSIEKVYMTYGFSFSN